jgi:putative tryptophan/tyrosine transport system substrate-binding protein
VNRRAFVTGLGAVLAAPIVSEAQQAGKIYRIGFISMRSGPTDNPQLEAFRQGLREMGYFEGQNVLLEIGYAGTDLSVLPGLAAKMVRLNVDVIVAQSGVATIAAKRATQTIPIVMVSSGDAVRQGLVASLGRPGGNVTGLTMIASELSQKRLEVLRELLPMVSRVGVLWCGPGEGVGDFEWPGIQTAADVLRIKPVSLEVRDAQDPASAFALAKRQGIEAIIGLDCSRLNAGAGRITELAMANRVPTMYPYSIYPEAGGLMSYGPDLRDGARRAATFVDKILKGAKPADLPIEQPLKFELVINLKTAKALGLTIPPSLLLRADQVIE